MIAYRATSDVPRETVQFTARLLAAERRRGGTPRGSRALTGFWQAVLGLRWFRDRASPDALARDHGISRATAYRYLDEVTAVLAAQAPGLRAALERAAAEGVPHVVLDGTLIRTDRCRDKVLSARGQEIDLWYCGKARAHGGNVQAVLAPGGLPLWVSDAEPGSVHDITAARTHALPALYAAAAAGLTILADAGYDGASPAIHIPAKPRRNRPALSINARTRNMLLRSVRCRGERGFALLKGRWRTPKRITSSPGKITAIIRAALVLTQFEHGYLK